MLNAISFNDRDNFNRKPFACNLIKLLESDCDVFPLAINGAWGTGKTEFCIKTVHLINTEYSDKLVAGYFDAFSEDHFNDPLTSLLAILYRSFVKSEDKAKILTKISRVILTVGQKIISDSYPMAGELISEIKKLKEETVKENFVNRVNIESRITELRNLIDEISHNKTFVLFIDELDRCRPDFALHLLEIVKHIFNAPRLKIIFVINIEQLAEIVKHNYGNNEITSRKYLDKFFHIQLRIPNFSIDAYGKKFSNSIKYFEIELERLGLLDFPLFKNDRYSQSNNSLVLKLLNELIEFRNLSLRDIEKLTKHLYIYATFTSCNMDQYLGFKLITAYAIFQFTFNEQLYVNYQNQNVNFSSSHDILINEPPDGKIYKSMRYVLYELLYGNKDEVIADFSGSYTLPERRSFLINTFSSLESLINN